MSAPVVISGMHRSATSLLASMFHRAGLHLGNQLLAPSSFNLPGYFEDLDFIRFHDALLSHLGTSMYLKVAPRGTIEHVHRAHAESLIAARRNRPAWGWKDPRNCLFLEFWRSIVPDAVFVFVFRDPGEVIDSFRRRGDAELHLQYRGAAMLAWLGVPRFRMQHALHMWLRYNERIAEFAEKHRHQCYVIRSVDLASGGSRLIDEISASAGLSLSRIDGAEVIRPELIVRRAAPAIERFCRRSVEANILLRRLEKLADGHCGHV